MIRDRNARPGFLASGAALAVLLALFACVRVATAWFLRHEVHGDLAVVQMMVRDMLEGKPIPAFFSGQAYMGTLEPIASALLCRLSGHGDFSLADGGAAVAASLGTALFMLLAAVFVWRVALRIGGDWAGVVAVAFLAIGPRPFVHYSVSERGGYGVLLFTVAALLDTGGTLVARERRDGRIGFAPPLFAGLVLGIGIWCNQLAFPAALAAGAGLALFAPSILLRWRLWLGGAIGFAAGSFPFWFWNARNDWESFRMASGLVLDGAVFARNIMTLVAERVPMVLGVDSAHAPFIIRLTVTGAAAIAMLLSLLAFAPPPRRIDVPFKPLPGEARAQLAICWIFLAFFAFCFAASHFAIFNTPRYLLATLPAVAAIIGAACAVPRFKSARIVSALCLAVLVAWQVRQFPLIIGRGRKNTAQVARYMEAVKTLRSHSIRAAYCSFRHNTMNLCMDAIDHEPVFTDFLLERRPDFRHLAEIADSPAVVDDSLGLARWIAASGGTATFESPCGIRLAYNVRPPEQGLAEIDSSEWMDADKDTPLRPLYDRSIATSRELPGKRASVTISFRKPETLSCVRALVSGIDVKASCRVEGRESPDAPFRRLSPDVPYVRAIWSGPRFYPVHGDAPFDIHFAPQTVESVRIVFSFAQGAGAVRKLHELQLLSPATQASETTDWTEAARALLATLRIQGVNRLYATRWVANWIAEETSGQIKTNCGDDLDPKPTGAPRPPSPRTPVVLDGSTALLASPSGAASLRKVLETSMIAMREIPCGTIGTLFIPKTIQRIPLDKPSGIIFDADLSTLLPDPDWMESRIAALDNEEAPGEKSAHELARVLASHPTSFTAFSHAFHRAKTDAGEQAAWRAMGDLLCPPPSQMRDADFGGGSYRWNGTIVVSHETGQSLRPGETMRLRHYWMAPLPPQPGALRVFTHFVADNGYRFQDDFDFDVPPEGPETTVEPYGGDPMIWHTDRNVVIPPDAPEGEYEMRLGLYDAVYSSRRLGVKAQYTRTRRGAAIIPDIFFVTHQPAEKENAE